MTPLDLDCDVAVVGYGPVGATAANLLARLGLKVVVIEREPEIYDKPRAIGGDHEFFRVMQWCGIGDQFAAHTADYRGTDYLGVDGEVIRSFVPPQRPYPLGWPPSFLFVQPELERMLREAAARRNNVTVMLGYGWKGLERIAAGCQVIAEHTTSRESLVVRAKYVLACDGASSPIRTHLNIPLDDLRFDETWAVIDAWLLDPVAVPERNIQYCWPKRPASYIVGPGALRRWELKLLPGEDRDSFDFAALVDALSSYVDPGAVDLWRTAVYRFHALVAERWRHGNVFLVGDSAHQTPPFLGQGLCSGIRDVANLAWKLAMVIQGTADESLLDSYEREREPQTRRLVELAKEAGRVIGELDEQAARLRDARLRAMRTDAAQSTQRHVSIPGIREGILDRGNADVDASLATAGELCVQPLLRAADGRLALFDEVVDLRFVIAVVSDEASSWLDEVDRSFWAEIGGAFLKIAEHGAADDGAIDVLHETEGMFRGFAQARGYAAVVIRPDRYIYGAARTRTELKRMLQTLRVQLRGASDTQGCRAEEERISISMPSGTSSAVESALRR
ncbi:bifunctional 3-(3-hydroxy-phenyl)propionate/3-hydroxycinnamic acid hydroxylase [Paraburkholderia oxyphila]|uniref:bifunctional 3-(3-hydroxy-phenyl)propionate/3-hydroxycinnamic acid hydroxylase n=1 Tax=Paraburkholderia oxyphila TaxID=614212 RepID=UPI00069391F2|nr:bifunctional 3-(3-hydroxy-phenyl)propionate/3-hydroxycinnamic acid hydroxylase [Paraburkholderia oxyphila]